MNIKRRDSKGRVLRNGEVQRQDGKYMFRYTGTDGSRHAVYSWRLVETDPLPPGKRDNMPLRDQEKQIQRDLDDGIDSAEAARIQVDDLFQKFMSMRTDLKETTRNNYTSLYNSHVRNQIGYRRVNSIKPSTIQLLYTDLVETNHLKLSSMQSLHSIIYQMFDIAVQDDVIRKNPANNVMGRLRKTLNFEETKRHALTETEQSRFIEYVYTEREFRRWGPLFTVLLGTGMRMGEALGLRWCDCDLKQRTISVNHALLYKPNEFGKYRYLVSKPKTRSGIREIPMLDDVYDIFRDMKRHYKKTGFSVDGYKDFIFLNGNGKVFTPNAVYDAFQRVQAAYNREELFHAKQEGRDPILLPKFSAHNLRHTFCTRYCENEPNLKIVQEIMGHKSFRTTMDVYNEATDQKKRDSIAGLQGKIKVR